MSVRSSARAPALLALSLGLAALVAACTLPGSTLGTYDVRGSLGTDTCGAAPNPWTFSVMLSQEGQTLYWSWMDASPILSGPLTSAEHATLTGYQIHNVDSTATAMGPCDLERSDDLEVTLGGGSPPASFGGTITYSFSQQVGANCSDQLAASGGMYDTLPCTVSYTMAGTRR